ncbi:hypothetical protein GPECTOR_22g813 [Gonium pectorale]|uniref:IPT/TIG domain-containing protein n=1 Tax=Gonium pectorale TaxID=33097 RepID=A0A150GH96_GONPE|nr:hypothetical protein GPECTOR_22g813 [Gonium pectorale]|eukprot:KXZ49222.1 hypothetical protein GPECTOR_22g813 [Gonium pectorale]
MIEGVNGALKCVMFLGLKALSPSAGPPGTSVLMYGDATWSLRYRDCIEASWGEVQCVGSILFGDYLCGQDTSLERGGIRFANWEGYERYGANPYRVACILPAPDGSNAQPTLGTAGNVNVTWRLEGGMRGGLPEVLLSSYKYNVDGKPYHFQLYAEVTDISPSVGSVAGGTLVQISGRGFPTLELGRDDRVNVSISGVPCTVINSTYDTVFCVTGPKPVTPPHEATPIRGLYPGMRGVEYDLYDRWGEPAIQYSQLWELNTTIQVANPDTDKLVVTDVWEGQHYQWDQHCSRMKAFFVAPHAGSYRFYLQADDFGQVNATWLQDGAEVSRMIINVTTSTYIDSYSEYAFQSSAPIQLAANQRILLESAHCNNVGTGTQQLAVRMPVPEPRANSLAEVQTIAVTASTKPRQLLVKYLYGAGANTTAYFINITSLDDSKLDSPAVGLQLTFSGGSAKVILPLAATSTSMDTLIESAFGGVSMPNSGDLFGVRKIRGQGTLVLQLGINSVLARSVGFRIANARIVAINTTADTISSAASLTCTPATPVTYVAPPPPPPPTPTPKITNGIMVVVVPALPVSAIVPGGDFYLGLPNSDSPLLLSYSTSAAEMQQAIYNLTQQNVSVSASTNWREGTYFARVWNITFAPDVFDNVPNIVASHADTTPAGVLLSTEVRPANPPIWGSFRLAYGNYCESVSISLTDSGEAIRTKLGSLPGMAVPQKVETSGSPSSGYIYRVTFDPFNNPGDQPLLRVTDISGLNGLEPAVTVTTVMDGSTDAFYSPIPTEFLQLAVSEPGSISLVVNGAHSACAHPSGVCKFTYADAATPQVAAVSPTRIAFGDESSLPLTVIGSGFAAGGAVNVTVGSTICAITSVADTQIVCSVPNSAPAGLRAVTVNVAGLGNAIGSVNVTLTTLRVTGITPSSAVLASGGFSIINVTGRGFDRANCANNRVLVGGVRCGILACSSDFATVLYPGGSTANGAVLTIAAQVLEGGAVLDEHSPTSPAVQVDSGAPAITGISSPTLMPAAGGAVTVALAGATASDVVGMYLVPGISDVTNFTAASAAYKSRMPCSGVAAAAGAAGVACTSGSVPIGAYHVLVVLTSGLQLLSSDTVLFDLIITSVTPNAGSIGGGTVVNITGYGFSPMASENVVLLPVPVSSTFPNGIIQCRILQSTASWLTCLTAPHLAANASADDPFATNVLPVATAPKPVSVVLCSAGYNSTILVEYCASMAGAPRSRADTASGASASYTYSTVLTPSIDAATPSKGSLGTSVTLSGSNLIQVQDVEFLQAGAVKGLCAITAATDGTITCTVPDLASGVYSIRLKKANGEISVDPYGRGTFTAMPSILGLSGNAGSLVGGRNLTISVGGAGAADGISTGNVSRNSVTIGGLTCPVVEASRSSVTCTAPGMNGYVYAEYWNLGQSTYTLPDLTTFTNPVVARFEKGIAINWGTSSPLMGSIQTDFFGARFTFYLQVWGPGRM